MTELSSYYKNIKRAVRQNLLLYLGLIVGLMALTSVFLGSPFIRTVTMLVFTYRTEGWFFEKTWLMYLIILFSGLLAVIRGGAAGVKNFKALRNILYMDCDARRLLRICLLYTSVNQVLRQQEEDSASMMSGLTGGMGGGFPF